MVQQAERAFITGLNLVDLRMSSAKKRSDQVFMRVRG
jgi:hypothetical protein